MFRANTELVQTDVTVFDEDGRFADGLGPKDFELRIDGRLRPIAFFERVTAGTAKEAALGGGGAAPSTQHDRGRTIFFYIDDLHLDLASLDTTRKVINDFIDGEMSQTDEVAIASASGQAGFLQQLSDNKTVLRRALQRIAVTPPPVRDHERPLMTEYHATLIDRFAPDILAYFVDETLKLNPLMSREGAEAQVRMRASTLLHQSSERTAHTFSGLEGLIRASSALPGRKLVFFLSGGFLLDHGNSDVRGRLRRVTTAAARSGAVIYSIDARGLVASLTGASVDVPFDSSGRLLRASVNELAATQDGLNALARDTGGKPIFNTNALGSGLSRALHETSVYYLLAWEPDRETQKAKRFRTIEVKLVGKPGFTARVRSGFLDVDPPTIATDTQTPANDSSETRLREALTGPYPHRAIPISLSENYLLTTDRRPMLITSLHIPSEILTFSPGEGKQQAAVRIVGLISDDRGQAVAHFNEAVGVSRDSADLSDSGSSVSYTHQVFLGPGLYQVRAAARDERSGRTGSAHSWIEIPELAPGHIGLSSLLVGTARADAPPDASGSGHAVTDSIFIQRRFQRDATLRFFLFAYNAARSDSDARPDLASRLLILRDNHPVVTTPFKKITPEDAEPGLPYAADLSLRNLFPGPYVLRVEVIDRISRTRATRQTRFDIE